MSIIKKSLASALLAVGLLGMQQSATAASLTWNFSESEKYGAGTYGSVTVTEGTGSYLGDLLFSVKGIFPTNWNFTDFMFNVNSADDISIEDTPVGWSEMPYNNNGSMTGYAKTFGVFTSGTETDQGNDGVNPLDFRVDGSTLTLASLAVSTGQKGGWLFGAHMKCGAQGNCGSYTSNGVTDTSHWVAAGPNPVPLPAAAWLFGSALLGFMGFSVRRRV